MGVGITPVRALFESIPAAAGELTLLYRARSAEDLVLRAELDALAERRGATVHYLLGARHRHRRAGGPEPLSRESLSRLVPRLDEHEVYLCGPDGLVAGLVRALRSAGVPARRIHHESFSF